MISYEFVNEITNLLLIFYEPFGLSSSLAERTATIIILYPNWFTGTMVYLVNNLFVAVVRLTTRTLQRCMQISEVQK